MRGIILFALWVLTSLSGFSQDKTCDISAEIDVPQTGWNKLLQAGGNTLLFHFENNKGILVKAFDKSHKEIASRNHTGNKIDLTALEQSFFDGLYDINNEAVLFITQKNNDSEALFRLRFDVNTASLISEENVSALSGFDKNTTAFVLKEPSEEVYYILSFSKRSIETSDLMLTAYNDRHEPVKKIPLGMVKKGYNEIHLLSQEIDHTGSVLITTELTKTVQHPYSTEKYIVLYYLPKGSDKFSAQILKMPQGASDFNIKFTDNTYANTINIFISSLLQQPSLPNGEAGQIFFHQLLLVADKEMNTLSQIDITNNKIAAHLKEQTGSEHPYAGNIFTVNANNKGNTIVLNEDLLSKTDNKGNNAAFIGITEYDHEGSEKWATVVAKGMTNQPEQDYSSSEVFKARTSAYELSQVLCINDRNDHYIIYNDLDENFSKGINQQFRAVSDYNKTNTVYYKLNRKKELTKEYLFGAGTEGEYRHIYTNSGNFDRKKNVFITVMLRSKGEKATTHIAWCKLGN